PRPPPRAARAAARGDEGDDVPRRLRRRRPAERRVLLLPGDVRRRLRRPRGERRPRRRADARSEHGERARRGDRAQLPGARHAALARRRLRRARSLPRWARPAQGLPLRPADDVHRARRPHRPRPVGRARRPRRQAGGVRLDPRRRRDDAEGEGHDRGAGRRRGQLPYLRRRRVRAAGRARPRRRCARRARGQGQPRARAGGVRVDAIAFEVIRNALVAATDQMVLALRRSAYSTNIKTRSDFSSAFFDAELRSVAQGFAQPVHLGSMVEQVPKAILAYGRERLGHGDMLLTNDPYPSGVHLNDVSLIAPVHVDGELIGYVANIAHHVDVGGGAPASIGAFKEVFQEGVIIPPVKLVAGGRIVPDIFKLVLAQIRSKHETSGDMRAQIAANTTGVRRVQALVERHGREAIAVAMRELLDYTERRTRAELAQLPHGTYEAEGVVDNDGYTDEPVKLKARVTLGPDGAHFDTTGSDPQRRAPVNSTYAMTLSACPYMLKGLIDPDPPANDG